MEEAIVFKSSDDEARFNEWTKEQLYVAYLSEYNTRAMLNIELNKAHRLIAEIKYKCTK